jgi:ribosomal protein L14E/L6E/L27E
MSFGTGFVGAICISKCGHDKGSLYVITGVQGDKFALVVNGENRPLKNPKRKNIAHISITKHRTAATSDSVIKKAIASFGEAK